MKNENIFPILFDFLTYYKFGNYQRFRVCLNKIFDALSYKLDITEKRIIYNITYRRLREFGLLEEYEDQSALKWRIINNSVIKTPKGEHCVVGSSKFIRSFLKLNNVISEERFCMYSMSKNWKIDFRICFPTINFKSIKKNHQHPLEYEYIGQNKYMHLWQLLPSMSYILKELTVKSDSDSLPLEYQQIDKFDFINFHWKECSIDDLNSLGYFRLRGQYFKHRYFIRFNKNQESTIVETFNSDYTYLIATYLLDISLYWKFNHDNESLSIPKLQFPFLPLLLRRSMLYQTMKFPDSQLDSYLFHNISGDMYIRLSKLFPMTKSALK